jgi:hypothetical protein
MVYRLASFFLNWDLVDYTETMFKKSIKKLIRITVTPDMQRL